jgi:hypothetical protein
MTQFAGGSAPAAWRNAVKELGSYFRLPVIHTCTPKGDFARMLPRVREKAFLDFELYAERLEQTASSQRRKLSELQHELRLIKQANDRIAKENIDLSSEVERLRLALLSAKTPRRRQPSKQAAWSLFGRRRPRDSQRSPMN